MAVFPCLMHGERYEGSARNVYLSLYDGDNRVLLRYVVCKDCEEDLVAPWLNKALFRGESGEWEVWPEGVPLAALYRASGGLPARTIPWQRT